MLRRSPIRRPLAGIVLALTAYVLGAGAFHLHPHPGPASPLPQWSAQEEGTGQDGSPCPLCRIAQQPISASSLQQGAARPLAVPAPLEAKVVEQPRHTASAAAQPRAPPAASSVC